MAAGSGSRLWRSSPPVVRDGVIDQGNRSAWWILAPMAIVSNAHGKTSTPTIPATAVASTRRSS